MAYPAQTQDGQTVQIKEKKPHPVYGIIMVADTGHWYVTAPGSNVRLILCDLQPDGVDMTGLVFASGFVNEEKTTFGEQPEDAPPGGEVPYGTKVSEESTVETENEVEELPEIPSEPLDTDPADNPDDQV